MDVTNPEQARIAEDAGACAVMLVLPLIVHPRSMLMRIRALERIPADIRVEGGVSRMSDPGMIKGIMEAVSIPVMVSF